MGAVCWILIQHAAPALNEGGARVEAPAPSGAPYSLNSGCSLSVRAASNSPMRIR